MSMKMVADVVADAGVDSLKLLPFLFVTYVLMEYLEHKTSTKTRAAIRKAGRMGPAAGGIAGLFPQCGFSAAASNLYAGGVITMGTLLAVFLSTSDEMLPIFVSEAVSARTILQILGLKALLGAVTGFLVDFLFRSRPSAIRYKEIHSMCESEHCGCEEGILLSAWKHTFKIAVFIFIISLALGFLVTIGGEERIASFLSGYPFLGPFAAGLIGLLPNCAASVVITQLFLEDLISFGTMMSGLLVGAGVGLLVLFRANKHGRENFVITGILYGSGVVWGILIDLVRSFVF